MWDMVGGDNFSEIGHKFLRYFIDFGLVKPEDDVLDIGCGLGRMAVPFTKYLDSNSVYEGLEVYTRSFR